MAESSLARSKTAAGAVKGAEKDSLPCIGGMTGGEVTWKVPCSKPKAQPVDQDAFKETPKQEANKGRRHTQAMWKDKIKEAKAR